MERERESLIHPSFNQKIKSGDPHRKADTAVHNGLCASWVLSYVVQNSKRKKKPLRQCKKKKTWKERNAVEIVNENNSIEIIRSTINGHGGWGGELFFPFLPHPEGFVRKHLELSFSLSLSLFKVFNVMFFVWGRRGRWRRAVLMLRNHKVGRRVKEDESEEGADARHAISPPRKA